MERFIKSNIKIRKIILITLGVMLMFTFLGCGGSKKYKLSFNSGGFESGKNEYAAGQKVTVYYDLIATDTDYSFSSADVEFKQSYDEKKGYVLTFTMPDHDVYIEVEWENSMEYREPQNAILSFSSFDGGGPGYTVSIDDESIAAFYKETIYLDANHDEIDGAAKRIEITFEGVAPGETQALIKERSPIAGNRDLLYKLTVDGNLCVTAELISTKDIDDEADDVQENDVEADEMKLYIGGTEVPVTWEDNESVTALKDMLPLSVSMSMYGGFEQVGSLGGSIVRNDKQTTTDPGDIVLYSGNQIVIFYGSNSWAYTMLGHVDLSQEELAELLGNGNVDISLE